MMKNCFSIKKVWLFCLLLIGTLATAQTDSTKALRLFLIGNSFSQNASRYLPQLAKEGGFQLSIGRAELGGCSLQRHWELVEAAEANDPKGKAYNGKSLKELLSDGKWDVVTIQQASILSGDSNTYKPYAQKLYAFIKKIQPEAQVLIHQTWPYRIDSRDFTQIGGGGSAKMATEMWQYSRAAYHAIAANLNIQIIPVGDAFQKITQQKKTAYKVDENFDVKNAVKPNLPNQSNSLHVGYFYNKEKLELDAHHASNAGCYLAGLVWYQTLFHASVKKIKFQPEGVSDEWGKQLRKVAAKVASK